MLCYGGRDGLKFSDSTSSSSVWQSKTPPLCTTVKESIRTHVILHVNGHIFTTYSCTNLRTIFNPNIGFLRSYIILQNTINSDFSQYKCMNSNIEKWMDYEIIWIIWLIYVNYEFLKISFYQISISQSWIFQKIEKKYVILHNFFYILLKFSVIRFNGGGVINFWSWPL